MNRVVLTDGRYEISWDGAYLRVTMFNGDKLLWEQRVCATDGNVEDVARAWWDGPIGKAKVEA